MEIILRDGAGYSHRPGLAFDMNKMDPETSNRLELDQIHLKGN